MRRVLVPIVFGALAAGCSQPSSGYLAVDLRTDYEAASDFQVVQVELMAPGSTSAERTTTPAVAPSRFGDATRVAEFSELPAGRASVIVQLRAGDGVRAERQVLVELGRTARVVTAVITRSCEAMACPDGQTCSGGECVDARCSPESPEHCPAPDCETVADCAPITDPCREPVCIAGVCASGPGDSACGDGGMGDAGDAGVSGHWETGDYGACSNTCGTGTQTRPVTCVDDAGESVPLALCTEPAPEASRSCEDMSGCCVPGTECAPPSGHRTGAWVCRPDGRVFYAIFEFRRYVCSSAFECEVAEAVSDRLECICVGEPATCDPDTGCGTLAASLSGCDAEASGEREDCAFVGNFVDPGCYP